MGLLAALAACDKALPGSDGTPDNPAGPDGTSAYSLRIMPVITKVTDLNFEQGDAIGVTVTRGDNVYAANQKLTYAGTEFSGSLNWYLEPEEESSILAYYPYAESLPASFSVQTDQSAGTSASDFVVGAKKGLRPTDQAVLVPFKHLLTKVNIALNNKSGKEIVGVALDGAIPTVALDASFDVTADENAQPAAIKACKVADNQFTLILPPQTVSFTAVVTVEEDHDLSQKLAQATLVGGKAYDLSIVVLSDQIKVVLSGELEHWGEGGDLEPEDPGDDPGDDPGEDPGEDPEYADWAEHLDAAQPYFEYHKVKYNVVKMKDNKWWMAQNLAYIPEGFTPAADLTAVTAGVFYPLRIKDDQSGAEFDTSAEGIAANGYYYQSEVALGLNIGDITTLEQALALEGVQGVCPEGWHVPTLDDVLGLVGKASQVSSITTPYNAVAGGDCYIKNLNADGFNMKAYGAISIQDNTKTSGTMMGYMTSNPDHLASGMFCGSTVGYKDTGDRDVTYNESGKPESGILKFTFYGFMPMTNKASEDLYTCNGTKVSYRIAAPLRCVRNPEQ